MPAWIMGAGAQGRVRRVRIESFQHLISGDQLIVLGGQLLKFAKGPLGGECGLDEIGAIDDRHLRAGRQCASARQQGQAKQ